MRIFDLLPQVKTYSTHSWQQYLLDMALATTSVLLLTTIKAAASSLLQEKGPLFSIALPVGKPEGITTMSKPGARVLVVDDEIEIIRALQRSLIAHGYKVFPARSGEDAIELFQQHRPDLVLLDLMLPGMSGLEVCQSLRMTSSYTHYRSLSQRHRKR